MELAANPVYPTHPCDLQETDSPVPLQEHVQLKDHAFDLSIPLKRRRKKHKEFKVAKSDDTACNKCPVRQYYKVDQSKISDLKKM